MKKKINSENKKKIKYLCYFDTYDNNGEKRTCPLAAASVISSKVNTLCDAGFDVEIVSASSTLEKINCHGSVRKLRCGAILRLFYSLGRKNILTRIINNLFIRIQIFYYLLTHTDDNTLLIVYHSLSYMKLVRIIKKITEIPIVFEMNEIYADVIGEENKKEIEYANKVADAFIFPTILLNEKVNTQKKPYILSHGTYTICEPIENLQPLPSDFIHCVYAGTLDTRKGGAAAAVAAAAFLSSDYWIHILGFGTENEVEDIKLIIGDINKKNKGKVTFEGTFSGKDYNAFLQSCDIGLCTQNPNEAFNDTSFPSKILTYLANGLRVVSVNIPAVSSSAVSDLLFYYNKQSPNEIAKAIMRVDLSSKYDSRTMLLQLEEVFKSKLHNMICSLI